MVGVVGLSVGLTGVVIAGIAIGSWAFPITAG
jgi:hypothetical protein